MRFLQPAIDHASDTAAAVNWWLSGGIDPGDVTAAYQAKGAASLAASLLDLQNSLDLTEQGSVTWDAVNGWNTFSDVNYIDSSAAFTSGQDPRTVIVRFVSDANYTNVQNIVGLSGITAPTYGGWSLTPELAARYVAGNTVWSNDGSAAGGVFCVTYSGGTTANVIGYLDGSLLTASSRTDITPSTSNKFTIGRQVSGATNSAFSGTIQGLAVYSKALSAPEVSAVSTALAAI